MSLPERTVILKGESVTSLEPLVLIKLSPNVRHLQEMRTMLARFKYMSSTDSFVDPSGFAIHKEDEPGIQMKDALRDYRAVSHSGSRSNESGEPNLQNDGLHTKSSSKKSEYPELSILSRPLDESTKTGPGIIPDYFEMPHDDKDKLVEDKLPKSQINFSNPIRIDKAAASKDKVANAKTLNKEQTDSVFEINNIFGGISFVGPIGACSQIFEPPNDLSRLIWVYDQSSLEVQTFESSTMNSMYKQGAWGISPSLAYKGLSLGGGIGREYSHETRSEEGHQWVTGVYRYPRAVIRLPMASMQPTETFQNELAAAFANADDDLKKARLLDFFAVYGQAFAFEVQLGGHLHTTLYTEEEIEKTKDSKSAKFEVQAGFADLVGLSGKYERKSGSASSQSEKSSSLVVEAVGGDTLLSSNLELWPASVMPHTNWRITRRAEIYSLISIPSLFSEERRKEVERLLGPFEGKTLPLPKA